MSKINYIANAGILLGILFFSVSLAQKIDPGFKKMIEEIYSDFPTIQPKDAQKLIGKDQVYFLDTRTRKEYDISHIPGAIWIAYDPLEWFAINKLPRDARLIVYCSVGARSQNVGRKLRDKGFKHVQNLYGGLFLWANQEREMRDSQNEKTVNIHGYDQYWGKWIKKGKVIYP